MYSKPFNIVLLLFIGTCLASTQPARPARLNDPSERHGRAGKVGQARPGDPTASTGFDKYLITFEHIPSPNFGIINCIIRDDRGFLWFGTTKGLCKYDGYQVRVLAIGSVPAGKPLEDNQQFVTTMIKLGDGSLLLATHKGLWTFDPRTEQSAPFPAGPATTGAAMEFSESRINVLAEDSSGTIWIGTSARGLFSYERSTQIVQRFSTTNGLSNDRISTLVVDRSGALWIGTNGGGLNVLDRSTMRFTQYRKIAMDAGSLWSDRVASLCEGGDHDLWIGTFEGVNLLDLKHRRMRRVELPSPIRHTVSSMARDPSGNMWIAASELGLLQLSNGRFMLYETPTDANRSLSSIKTLYLDPVASTGTEFLFWIGTRYGVNKVLISQNPFSVHIRNQQSLRLNRGAVLSLCEDRKGILWLGLWGGGLNGLEYEGGTYRRVFNFEANSSDALALPNRDVGAVLEDSEGNLWIGTAAGLAMLDSRRKHMVIDRHVEGDSMSLVANDVSGVYESRSGTVWIYGRGGLSQLIRGEVHRFKNYFCDPSDAHPIQGNVVSSVLEDNHSKLWVGTFGKGLNRLEVSGKFTRFTHPGDSSGNQENFIYTFAEDHQGFFWLSTLAGLVSFDPRTGQFRRHEIEQLHDAHIFGIAGDHGDELWLSTEIGLVRFNPKTQAFVKYDDKDGLPFKELFSGFYRDARGRLLVGGIDGFAEFSPEEISTSSNLPEVAITGLSVFDKELSASARTSGNIRLPYDQNFLLFSFAVLDYANPERNRFAYKLEGVDKSWVEAGTRNYTSYANLHPGDYVFQVKGCNSANVWSKSGASISITPPYWQAWWFRTLVLIVIGGTMYAAYRYRLQKLLEVERLRLRIADDLHDDIGSNLSTIAMVSRTVRQAPGLSSVTKSKLEEIYDTAVTTSAGMRDIVWFIKPKNDTLDDLFLRMKDTASSLLCDVEHDFLAPENGGSLKVPIDFKRDFFLAFKEILTNIVKHASATRVQIRVLHQDGILEIVVRDNGRGFDPSKAEGVRRGNGLGSLRSRARNVGGVCEIISTPGKGTTVRFSGKV